MKLLTLNFLTCAVASCKKVPHLSFPLHPKDAELEIVEIDFNPLFLRNVMPRMEWDEMVTVCSELGLALPPKPDTSKTLTSETNEPASSAGTDADIPMTTENEADTETALRALHRVLLETRITSGALECGNCGHTYAIKEGIANFLLPAHLV